MRVTVSIDNVYVASLAIYGVAVGIIFITAWLVCRTYRTRKVN